MDRTRIPSCTRCKLSYQISDTNRYKVPMLLNCGHDMCKNCIKFMFKKNRQIICEVCKTDCKIESESDINNIPLHYYLLGKVWYLMTNKPKEMYRNLSNLQLRNLTSDFVQKSNICDSCHRRSVYFCIQCNEMFCESCFPEHIANQNFSYHEVQILSTTNNEFIEEKTCDQHLRPIDIICVTCQLDLCSICAIEDHRPHDIQPLEKYNLNSINILNEYSKKGENLLKKLKLRRDGFKSEILKHQDPKNELDIEKRNLTMFVYSAIGTLQCLEQNMLKLLNEAEISVFNSINKVTDQLSNAIDNLQQKLNSVDVMLRNRHNSSALLSEVINDIGREVNMIFYIAKRDDSKQIKIFLNYDIFMESIKKCIVPKVDKGDIYLLEYSPELPPNYSLYLKIDNALSSSSTASEIRLSSSLSSRSSQSSIPTDHLLNYTKVEQTLSPVNNYASYVKEITKTEIESIIVIHLNSPSDFYVQLHANISVMKLVETKLNEFIQNKHSIVDSIEKNNIMYAVQMSSNKWCRGNIIHILEEDNQNMYTVFFIDYGFTETVTADRIRNVSASITLIPPLAYNCALYNLKPSLTTGWSNDAYSIFSELMLEKTGSFYLYPINLDTERIEVEIVWKINDYKLPIRQAMFFMGYGGQFSQYVNDSLHKQLVNILTLPKREKLEIKERYNVILSHLISPSEFYFRIDDDLNIHLLRETMELLETKYRSTEIDTHKSYLLYTPQIGMAVAAKYSIDSNWYRAKIISLPEPRMVTVFYIDYGNSETLLWDQLRVLDKELIKTPPLAVKASLADIYPAIDGIESTSWNDLACAAFIELTEHHHNIDANLTALIHDIDDDTYNVILYNHTSRGEFCVNQKLLTRGFGANRNPMSIVFQKQNNEIKFSTDSDATVFIKPRSVTIQNHTFPKMDDENDVPGIKMLVIKVVSPYDITLKYADYDLAELTELMNKVYTEHKIKKIPKVELKKNNLCAVFIQKYDNWYRGKIVTVQQNKKTTSIYFYDLDETLDQISTNSLYILENRFVQAKCGLVHCCMDKLIPLGISDGNWPQFSCDRLIEELQKHNTIYFAKTGKKDSNTVLGEIWVKEVIQPKALEPLCDKWININKFMVEQGFAITEKHNFKDDINLNVKIDLNHLKSMQYWLPPTPLTQSQFKAYVMYVDMECNLYLQLDDSETSQLLKTVEEELNEIFANTKPEPENYKWTENQMVIVKYHLDKKWYRGTIIKKNENGQYKVQFLDYGNIETCSHEQLRSTVYMTDIPQLCIKGFFSNISPCSKNNVWNIANLDHIHSVLVEKPCTVTVDLNLSFNNLYGINFIKTEQCPDICQYLVNHNIACYSFAKEYVDPFNFGDTTDEDWMYTENNNYAINRDEDGIHTANNNDEINNDKIKLLNIADCEINFTDDNRTMTNKDKHNFSSTVNDKQKITSFSRFRLNVEGEVIEGKVCDIVGPTRIRFLVYKINGHDIIDMRDKMHRDMFNQCVDLPVLEKFEPGTAVIVLHTVFWRRGIISDNCESVMLVDMGISIQLIKNNLRPCPPIYFELPMFSIECQLANLTINEHTDEQAVAKELSKLLRGVNLKIVGVDNLNANVVDVILFDENDHLPYQSLIDSKMLILK